MGVFAKGSDWPEELRREWLGLPQLVVESLTFLPVAQELSQRRPPRRTPQEEGGREGDGSLGRICAVRLARGVRQPRFGGRFGAIPFQDEEKQPFPVMLAKAGEYFPAVSAGATSLLRMVSMAVG